MPARSWKALPALLLLLPGALGADGSRLVADLVTPHLHVDAQSVLDSSPRALFYRSMARGDGTAFGLSLRAEAVHLEVDHQQSLVYAYGAEVAGEKWTNTTDLENVELSLEAARPFFKIDILLSEGQAASLRHTANCFDLAPAKLDRVEAQKFAQGPRQAPTASTAGSILADLCIGTSQLSGDFTLVLWEADIAVRSADGRQLIHTGEGMAQARGSEAPFRVHQNDQVYANVVGGHLTLARTTASGGQLQGYLEAGQADVQGHIYPTSPQGTVRDASGNAVPLRKTDTFHGALSLHSTPVSEGIRVELSGDPGAVYLNDAPLESQATTAAPQAPTWIGWLALGLAALVGVLVGNWRRVHWFRRAVRHLGKGHLNRAHIAARLALRRNPKNSDVHALLAVIHYKRDQHHAAIGHAEAAQPGLRGEAAGRNALVGSRAAARLDDAEKAGSYFALALRELDVEAASLLERDEPLHRISSDPRFQRQAYAWRNGGVAQP